MPTAAQYEQMIGCLRYPGIIRLWGRIQAKNTPGWDAGKALEYLILRAFQIEGATVAWPYQINSGNGTIEQIDGIVYSDYLTCIFECKNLKGALDYDTIAVLHLQLQRRPAGVIGCCFSTGGFTLPALDLTVRGRQEIALWDNDDIDYALRAHKMRKALLAKYRHCVERAMPDLNLRAARI
ncbi:MAG: hypothetical protein ACLQVX_05510 [Limisphaerales bacterium]